MLNLIKIRQDLHRIPELAFEEYKTSHYLLDILRKYDQLRIHTFDFPGIIVEYSAGKGDYKLFRSDMDGLPIAEETNCDFQSDHPGKMHACGHDMHMTTLLGLIDKVVNKDLKKNLLFVFQPAEEGKGGARKILDTGILDQFRISSAFALHVKGDYPVGTIASRSGIFFANTEEIDVIFRGVSAHVAFAWKGKDALKAGMEFYFHLDQEIRKEFLHPENVLCKFGRMEAGRVRNAVPAGCLLEGTLRALEDSDHKKLEKLVKLLVKESAIAHGVESHIDIYNYYKAVFNNDKLYNDLITKVAALNYQFVESHVQMGGEDFGFFADLYPGLLFLLGVDDGSGEDLHSSRFLPAEEAIQVGVNIFYEFI